MSSRGLELLSQVKALAKKRGITQADIARHIGLASSTQMCRKLSGQSGLRVTEFAAIGELVGFDVVIVPHVG